MNKSPPHPRSSDGGEQFDSLQELVGHLQQGLAGPLQEPVRGGRVDQGRVLTDTVPGIRIRNIKKK